MGGNTGNESEERKNESRCCFHGALERNAPNVGLVVEVKRYVCERKGCYHDNEGNCFGELE
jgi:hypothetical protein